MCFGVCTIHVFATCLTACYVFAPVGHCRIPLSQVKELCRDLVTNDSFDSGVYSRRDASKGFRMVALGDWLWGPCSVTSLQINNYVGVPEKNNYPKDK